VLKRGLSADPDGRFRSMKELLDALAAAAPASLEPGEMVTGRYVVAERIGSGKTSTVYRADDRLHDRQVALKVLSPWLVATRREELQRSAQTIVRLRHDNVVSIVDIGVFRGRLYAVVDLVDGFTFDAWLAREPRPSWQQKLDVLLQAARGLAAAHAAGMVHGGIKPSKVMVDRGGRAKMRDFALWGSVTSGEASAAEMHELQVIATRGGHVLGTPAYLAPEIYAGKPVDFSCDVFAFCLVAHEALYGEAFRCASSDERLAAIAAGLPATAPSGASPAGLYSIIRRGLSANPEDRPRSMDELVGALERIGSARPRWLIAVIIALVGLAVVAAWWAIR
jgi:serine/threonine protein kinase